MKKVIVESEVFDAFPEAVIAVVTADGLSQNADVPGIEELLRDAESDVVTKYAGVVFLDLPEIKKWRDAYKSFGANKKYRSSIESLLKRVMKGNELPSINQLVDIYNIISLRFLFPCGGEDLDRIEGDMHLTCADGSEEFVKILSEENEPPNPGEIIYKDGIGCICRCWNWREADRTKLTEETRNAVFVIETLSSDRAGELKDAAVELAFLIKKYTGAEADIVFLDKIQAKQLLIETRLNRRYK